MCVQEEIRYLIYDNINIGFLSGNGFISAPEDAESFVRREHAEKQLIINEMLSDDCIIEKCKIRYEIIEETEEEIRANLERQIKNKDICCGDCFYEDYNKQQERECSNTEMSERLKKKYLDSEGNRCPCWEVHCEMD